MIRHYLTKQFLVASAITLGLAFILIHFLGALGIVIATLASMGVGWAAGRWLASEL